MANGKRRLANAKGERLCGSIVLLAVCCLLGCEKSTDPQPVSKRETPAVEPAGDEESTSAEPAKIEPARETLPPAEKSTAESTTPEEKVSPTAAPPKEDRSAPPSEPKPISQVESTTPSSQAQQAKIFINNYKISASYGCYQELGSQGVLTCGPGGKSSHVTWKFLYRAPDGDVYEIARTYPAIESTFQLNHEEHVQDATSNTKQVLFGGSTLVVFEDDEQRVVLYPAGVGHPPTIDDQTPRVP